MFKDNHLNITMQCNLKIVNYLDVTFNLSNATYRTFCQPNNEIAYIYKESYHLAFLNIHLTKKYLKNLHKFIKKL